MTSASFVGVDIGGTSLRVVAEDEHHEEIRRHHERLMHNEGPDRVIEKALRVVATVGRQSIAAIGVAVSGPVDIHTGIVDNPWTLGGWRGVDVRSPFHRFGAPVLVENDANAAAAGEWARGAARGYDSAVAVTIGTGIGVGLIVDGAVFRGTRDIHPEGGHLSVADVGPPCYCGRTGCWEQLASGPALGRTAGVSPEQVLDEAAAGMRPSLDHVEELALRIGRGLRAIESLYAPAVIVLGGGLGSRLEWIRGTIENGWGAPSPLAPRPHLAFAELEDYSGAVGAAVLARRAVSE